MLNQIFEYTILKIKYSNWLKSILNKLFLLSYEKIIGDTYSKLWKFNNRVNHFMVLESSILYSDNRLNYDYSTFNQCLPKTYTLSIPKYYRYAYHYIDFI